MVAFAVPAKLNQSFVPLIALTGATIAAAFVASLPVDRLEAWVAMSGIVAIVPAAASPLGVMARLALMFAAAWTAAGLIWLVLRQLPIARPHRRGIAGLLSAPAVTVRRADAHPDAPVREPVFAARDLGTPFLEVRAPTHRLDALPLEPLPDAANPFGDDEVPLPDDLETPLVAYATGARNPAERVRIETFELTPPVPARSTPAWADEPPLATPETEATIHALLARLEQGVARRSRPPFRPATPTAHMSRGRERERERDRGNLEATLASLRRMAAHR